MNFWVLGQTNTIQVQILCDDCIISNVGESPCKRLYQITQWGSESLDYRDNMWFLLGHFSLKAARVRLRNNLQTFFDPKIKIKNNILLYYIILKNNYVYYKMYNSGIYRQLYWNSKILLHFNKLNFCFAVSNVNIFMLKLKTKFPHPLLYIFSIEVHFQNTSLGLLKPRDILARCNTMLKRHICSRTFNSGIFT